MSARVWKFFSNTIGKLASPRAPQQIENSVDSPSLHRIDTLPDTPTRHGGNDKTGQQLVDTIISSANDDSILNSPLNNKSNNIREKLEEASKPISKTEPQDDVQENVTPINTSDNDTEKPAKTGKKSSSNRSTPILLPRRTRNNSTESAKKVEPSPQNELPVDNTRKTRATRGRPEKTANAVVYDEAVSASAESNESEKENNAEVAEPLVKKEEPLDEDSVSSPKTRGRGRARKTVVKQESESESLDGEGSGSNGDIPAVPKSSRRDEGPATRRNKRPISEVKEPEYMSGPSDNEPSASKKRTRDESIESDFDSSAPAPSSTKRRKYTPKSDRPPPIGTSQAAKDERRKYMDRERQRRCRARKKERQQGEKKVVTEDLIEAKQERKKALARERVRRHRENLRQKGKGTRGDKGEEMRNRVREEARVRDRELIARGGRRGRNAGGEEEGDLE